VYRGCIVTDQQGNMNMGNITVNNIDNIFQSVGVYTGCIVTEEQGNMIMRNITVNNIDNMFQSV
jgi:hypothetical protein